MSREHIGIIMPSWVGDAVMATPVLRAVRAAKPKAKITLVLNRNLLPLVAGLPWVDETVAVDPHGNPWTHARLLRRQRFSTSLLLSNSFRWAFACSLARIPCRVGYARDGRTHLLTDRLLPLKDGRKYKPVPTVDYYLGLSRYIGAPDVGLELELRVTAEEAQAASEVLARAGLPDDRFPGPWVVLNPGARYGQAKCWPAEYYAQLADRCVEELGATVMLTGAPSETDMIRRVTRAMRHAGVDLLRHGVTLGTLKEVLRRSRLLVTNDTGPRHIAAAVGTPVLTLFGPTDPRWTEIAFAGERQLSVPVPCGPCQLKVCPLDHRCMRELAPGMVFDAARGMLAGK